MKRDYVKPETEVVRPTLYDSVLEDETYQGGATTSHPTTPEQSEAKTNKGWVGWDDDAPADTAGSRHWPRLSIPWDD